MGSYFFGGLCGMGMAPLAAFMREDGCLVRGFDDVPRPEVLEYLGRYRVELAPKDAPLESFDGVVITSALKKSAERFLKNGAKKIELRGERWARICASRRLAAVVGSHGKSTVSALSAHAAKKLGLGCGWLVGAIPRGFDMHRHCPEGEKIISEIDESDGTIENFYPEITAALNADIDHTDTYADWRALEGMFRRLFARTKRRVIYPESDPVLSRIAAEFPQKAVAVKTPPDFAKANAAMARALVEALTGARLPSGVFADFRGLARRQEIIASAPQITAVADYAHHPSEVKAFLKLFCGQYRGRSQIIVFQPHRYTRTRRFAAEFAAALEAAARGGAKVLLAPVYPASEAFDALGTSEAIAEKAQGAPIVLANFGEIFKMIKSSALGGENPAVAIVGAGDIYFEAREFFKENKWQK